MRSFFVRRKDRFGRPKTEFVKVEARSPEEAAIVHAHIQDGRPLWSTMQGGHIIHDRNMDVFRNLQGRFFRRFR